MHASGTFKKYSLALAISAAFQPPSVAGAFEWRELLGATDSKLIAALSDIAECESRSLSFEIPTISERTVVRPNFDRPIWSGGFISDSMPVIDYPRTRVVTCKIKDAAVIRSLVGHSGVFRISISYDRCAERAAAGNCLSDDLAEKSYDKKLYESMRIRDAYSLVGSPPDQNKYFERYEVLESDEDNRRRLGIAECNSDIRLEGDANYRCLIDARFEDGIFSALSMWELFKQGVFSEDVIARLASHQVFIAADAEKAELLEFMKFVGSKVDSERTKMNEKAARDDARGDRLDLLLGTQQ